MERGWSRTQPFLRLEAGELATRMARAVQGARVVSAELVRAGLRNTSYRVVLEGHDRPVLARFFTADASAYRKDLALARLLPSAVPVPSILGSDPEGAPPLVVAEWIAGEPFDRWLTSAASKDVRSASRSAGAILASIHAVRFPAAGFLGPDLEVGEPFESGGRGWMRYMHAFLFERGVGVALGDPLAARLWQAVRAHAARLDPLAGDRSLVHADYKPPNLIVDRRNHAWSVVGVLDWEFALAGPPLLDVGLFLRFERSFPSTYAEGFIEGYEAAGGVLPDDWRALARLLDLLSMCSLLDQTRDATVGRDVRLLIAESLREIERV